MKSKFNTKNILVFIGINIAIVAVILFACSKKVGYHMDEICTFGLANGKLHMEHELGKSYTGEELFRDYVTADPDARFDYKTVWENQAMDVHPPLYYVFIHTLSSLVPGQYSDLIGLIPNILFALVIYWQMCWMFKRFTDRKTAILIGALYMVTAAFVNTAIFFRMYALLTLVTNGLFMLFLKYRPTQNKDKWFYAGMYITIACGMLTQYYFSIICIFACFVYGVQLLLAKRTKDTVAFVATGMAGVGTAVAVFPKMIHHIFFGYRGKQAASALISDGLYSSIKEVMGLIDVYLFGGITLILAAIVLLLWLFAKGERDEKDIKYLVAQFILPVMAYVCIVSKVAPYKNERYVTNVTAVLWFAVFAILFVLVKSCKEKGSVFALVLAAAIVVFSYQDGMPNLQSGGEWKNTILDQRVSLPCVFVYDKCWRVIPNYVEMQKLQDVTFIDPSMTDHIDNDKYKNCEAMLVYISDEIVGTDFLDRIVENNPDIYGYEMLFFSGYSACYLLD